MAAQTRNEARILSTTPRRANGTVSLRASTDDGQPPLRQPSNGQASSFNALEYLRIGVPEIVRLMR